MYRFAKAGNICLYKSYLASMPNSALRLCSICNFYHPKITNHNFLQIRQNTTTKEILQPERTKKKVRKKQKKYAELLEVTDSSSSNRRASVKNLSAKQMQTLLDIPDISLDKLYKIRNLMIMDRRTELINEIMKENPEYSASEIMKENPQYSAKIAKEISQDAVQSNDNSQSMIDELEEKIMEDEEEFAMSEIESKMDELRDIEKAKKKGKKDKVRKSVMDEERMVQWTKEFQRNYNRIMNSYIDVCVNNQDEDEGYFKLIHDKKKRAATDIIAYNILMQKFAKSGNYRKLREILKKIRANEIALVPQSYAIIFECLARSEKIPRVKEVVKYHLQNMNKDNITFNDIIDECYFTNEDLLLVLKAIRMVEPEFEPTYREPFYSYSNPLLDKLTCDNNAVTSPASGLMTPKQLQKKINKQLSNEFEGVVVIKSIEETKSNDKKMESSREKIRNLEQQWRETVKRTFDKKLISLKRREFFEKRKNYIAIHPYLSVLSSDDYVDAIMKEVNSLSQISEGYSPSLTQLCMNLGSFIYKKYEMNSKTQNGVTDAIMDIHTKYCNWYINRTDGFNSRAKWQMYVHEAKTRGTYLNYTVPQWPPYILTKVGRFLYNIILDDLKIDSALVTLNKKKKQSTPAFYTVYRNNKIDSHLKQEVAPNIHLAKLYRDSKPENLQFDTSLLPCLCPPRPWLSPDTGGYLCTKSNIMRMPFSTYDVMERLNDVPEKQLYPAMDSLNQLGTIPWRVNKSILDIALKVFRNGGNVKLDIPEPPSSLPTLPSIKKNANSDEKLQYYRARQERKKKKNELTSLWCDTLYKLSLANHLRNETFWLPHSMDFRGRVYPIPPHMTHVSSDLARSMLVFALKKPLGPNGLDRLKIHTINLTGFKKKDSIEMRLAYANEILDKILDSAENPLEGEMWWSTSDEPWQTLAACMELNNALKSPDPENYLSGFPIHQDGSCNGLQHYAALGRDTAGAKSVNLCPSEFPQDVYASVANMIEEARKIDAENGIEEAQVLENFVKRKVIKQTVMTTVYGVTKYGARLQIAKQLKDLENFPQDYVWKASLYLVAKTFDSLRTMFTSAREIQDWFTECAKIIAHKRQRNVEWVTPLGLPIIQPYLKQHKSKMLQTRKQNYLSMEYLQKPNIMKQKNAFPPNFVHSLDSTHMMLTSLHCEHAGMTFVSVHDCFWTHSSTVDEMSKICREQFVSLHSQPILEDLSDYFVKKFSTVENPHMSNKLSIDSHDSEVFSRVPKKGDFNLNDVLKSVYFFS